MKRLLALLALSAQTALAQGITLYTVDSMDVGQATTVQAFLKDKQGRAVQPISTGTILWRSTSSVLRITRVETGKVQITAQQLGTGKIIASWYNQGRTWFDTATIRVRSGNLRPVARIQPWCGLGICELSAAPSSDPNGDALTFTWRAAGGYAEVGGMELRRLWILNAPNAFTQWLNAFTQWLVVADGRGGVDSLSHFVSIPPPISVSLTSSRDTVLQRPAPGQSDGTHLAIVQPTVLTNQGAGSAADVVFTTSDTTAATYTRNPTDGSLVVSDPKKNATITITAQYTRDGYTARTTKALVLMLRTPVPTSITVAVLDSSLRVNDSTKAVVAVTDQWGSILPTPVTWTSSNPTVLSITSTGTVTARAEGSAELRATASPTLVGRITLSVSPAAVSTISIGFDYTTSVVWPLGFATFYPEDWWLLMCATVTRQDGTVYLGDKMISVRHRKTAAGADSVEYYLRGETGAELQAACKNTSQLFPIEWSVQKFKLEEPVWLPTARAIIPPN